MTTHGMPQEWMDEKVSIEQAHESLRRLINSHFRNKDSARASIPANKNDDDIVMSRFVMQVAAQAQTIAELTTKLDEVRELAQTWKKQCTHYDTTTMYCADELLAILDAPTKPKEARNGEE